MGAGDRVGGDAGAAFRSPREVWRIRVGDAGRCDAVVAALAAAGGSGWTLSSVPFRAGAEVGRLKCDTGCDVSCVTDAFARRLGLRVTPHPLGVGRVRSALGEAAVSPGHVNLDLTLQLMLDVAEEGESECWAHWERLVGLEGVWVVPTTGEAPVDLLLAWQDWAPKGGSPMGQLAGMVLAGARVHAGPRLPASGPVLEVAVEAPGAGPTLAAVGVEGTLFERILLRFPEDRRSETRVRELARQLALRVKLFGPIDPGDCTEVIEMTLIGQDPKPVSFRVPVRRGAQGEAAEAGLRDWIARGICESVPWDTPAYGFVIVVPKAGGKWRVTINPAGVNAATERVELAGGFMPDSMLREAQRAGRCQFVSQLDLAEAFLTLKLGPEAPRLSTFTSPLGKLRWRQGYFGWHSFPAAFQRLMMEKVILPSGDKFPTAVLLAWIDDIVVGADDWESFVGALLSVLDLLLALGGRLSLEKCHFLPDMIDWCGVELEPAQGRWRIARGRVADIIALPSPADREALSHVLGVLRYYYFGVVEQAAQRERLAVISELDYDGCVVSAKWSPRHEAALRAALQAVASGKWLMVYRAGRPVWVATDASGNHGYCVAAWQYDDAGVMQCIGVWSKGWLSTQLLWTPQVKECYGQRQAVCVYMPETFPFADVILLTDNKNLAAVTDSEDLRVRRWQHDIACSGCITRVWVKGEFNTIADYGSRAVQAAPGAALSDVEQFELHIYALSLEGGGGPPGRRPVKTRWRPGRRPVGTRWRPAL